MPVSFDVNIGKWHQLVLQPLVIPTHVDILNCCCHQYIINNIHIIINLQYLKSKVYELLVFLKVDW